MSAQRTANEERRIVLRAHSLIDHGIWKPQLSANHPDFSKRSHDSGSVTLGAQDQAPSECMGDRSEVVSCSSSSARGQNDDPRSLGYPQNSGVFRSRRPECGAMTWSLFAGVTRGHFAKDASSRITPLRMGTSNITSGNANSTLCRFARNAERKTRPTSTSARPRDAWPESARGC